MRSGCHRGEAVTYEDHRGRALVLYEPDAESLLRGAPQGFGDEEFTRIRRRITNPDHAHGQLKGMTMVGTFSVGLGAVIFMLEALVDGEWWRLVWWATVLVSTVVVTKLTWCGFGTPAKSDLAWSRRHIDAFLAEKRCPACSYRIAGLVPEDDGCTVCPECGAAWRVPPVPQG